MAGVNKVIIVGRLGNNPEMRSFPNGDQVANLSVATSEKWQDKQSGDWKEVTEWHRIVLFSRLAEIAGQYLKKGFDECMRVLEDYGTLVFKWNETQITVSEIIKTIEYKPLIGHKSGKQAKTHWLLFMKLPK